MNYNMPNYHKKFWWRMKKMKTKLLVILSVMIFVGVVMVGPVTGATDQSTITGNISSFIDLKVDGNINNWALGQGVNINTTSITLNVTCNNPNWLVTVFDALDTAGGNPKNITTRGKMAEATSAGAYVGEYNLTTPMVIAGSTNASHYTGYSKSLNTAGTPEQIYLAHSDFTGAGIFDLMPIEIDQTVISADPVLPSTYIYKIIVTFVASLP
jgi:hypothetical protein